MDVKYIYIMLIHILIFTQHSYDHVSVVFRYWPTETLQQGSLGGESSWRLSVLAKSSSISTISIMICPSIFNLVTPKGICRTGRVHVYFRCRRLCERVFTALWAIFRVQEWVCLNAKRMCTELGYCNCEDYPNRGLSLVVMVAVMMAIIELLTTALNEWMNEWMNE